MTQINSEDFQPLPQQSEPEMSLKSICEQEGVDYRSYISWCNRNGYSRSRKPESSVLFGFMKLYT